MTKTTVLYSEAEIRQRVQELASELAQEYKDKKPVLIGVLKGSFIFYADLLRELFKQGVGDIEVDFMTITSYGSSTTYSGTSVILHDITRDIHDRHVLIVEDIIDTGHTLLFTRDYLNDKHPASIKIAAFLDKKARREADINADYVGFTLEGTPWVEGYGLDSDEYGRGRPEIIAKEIS